MQKWYRSITKRQKYLLFGISIVLSVIWVGLIPLFTLIYLELGERDRAKEKPEI